MAKCANVVLGRKSPSCMLASLEKYTCLCLDISNLFSIQKLMSDFAHFKEFVKITNVLILAVAHAAWTDVNCRGNYFEKIASWKRLDSATGSLFLNRQRNSFMPLFVAYRRKVLENALIVRLSRLPVSLILIRDSLTRQDTEQGLPHTTRQGQCHKTRLGHTTRRGTFYHATRQGVSLTCLDMDTHRR